MFLLLGSRLTQGRNGPSEYDDAIAPRSSQRPFDRRRRIARSQGSEIKISATRAGHDGRRAVDLSDLRATVPADDEGNIYAASFRSSSQEVASLVDVSEADKPGDVLVIDRESAGMMRRSSEGHDTGVVGVVAAKAGVVLGSRRPASEGESTETETSIHAEVSTAGFVDCKVDADYGAIWPGDLPVTSPTPGHAMRADSPLPGTIIGKALEPLEEGRGLISVLVMLR